jgi:hypothetical protein
LGLLTVVLANSIKSMGWLQGCGSSARETAKQFASIAQRASAAGVSTRLCTNIEVPLSLRIATSISNTELDGLLTIPTLHHICHCNSTWSSFACTDGLPCYPDYAPDIEAKIATNGSQCTTQNG